LLFFWIIFLRSGGGGEAWWVSRVWTLCAGERFGA
jgi:hypothetical protein